MNVEAASSSTEIRRSKAINPRGLLLPLHLYKCLQHARQFPKSRNLSYAGIPSASRSPSGVAEMKIAHGMAEIVDERSCQSINQSINPRDVTGERIILARCMPG